MDLFAIQRSKYQRGIRASLSATPSTVGFHLGSSLGEIQPHLPVRIPFLLHLRTTSTIHVAVCFLSLPCLQL